MKVFTAIVGIGLIGRLCNSQCTFDDMGSSGYMLDLRALEHATVVGNDDEYSYIYTPCRNGDQCPSESGTDTGMAIQTRDDPAECFILCNWDQAATKPTYDATDETWKFEYMNGNDCNGEPRHFYVYYNCNPSIGDYKVGSAGEISACVYEMYIDTKWACPGERYDPDDSSISGGTVFLIIFAGALFLYFVAGWIVCAFMNQKDRGFSDIVGNIPHLTFWSKLPALVIAGCCFTKDFCFGLCSGKKTDAMVTPNAGGDDYDNLDQ
eukprot:178721_1